MNLFSRFELKLILIASILGIAVGAASTVTYYGVTGKGDYERTKTADEIENPTNIEVMDHKPDKDEKSGSLKDRLSDKISNPFNVEGLFDHINDELDKAIGE